MSPFDKEKSHRPTLSTVLTLSGPYYNYRVAKSRFIVVHMENKVNNTRIHFVLCTHNCIPTFAQPWIKDTGPTHDIASGQTGLILIFRKGNDYIFIWGTDIFYYSAALSMEWYIFPTWECSRYWHEKAHPFLSFPPQVFFWRPLDK